MRVTKKTLINKPILKVGSKGEALKELQKLLFDYGMYLYVNSYSTYLYPDSEVINGVLVPKQKQQ